MLTLHQQKQIEVIKRIEEQIKKDSLEFSTISPVSDYIQDPRLCLTSIHFLNPFFGEIIQKDIQKPLQTLFSDCYIYPTDTLHMTIKNIKVIHDPPTYTAKDIKTASKILNSVVPNHAQFRIYPYKLLLFPTNLSIIGTTDPELDAIHLDLDKQLREMGIPDDKEYANTKYFFSNITIARFVNKPPEKFVQMVDTLSNHLTVKPYIVDTVTLVTGNASLRKRDIINTWKLKKKEVNI